MKLQLDYICTEAEMKEAQSLNLHQQCGGGPKWRSQVVLYGVTALVAALLYLRFKREVAREDRLWFIALVLLVFVGLQVIKRLTRAESDGTARLEISERELVIITNTGRSAMPWSAFSQCLESPRLFALLDRGKQRLYVVPKRAFPDEAGQNWFRTLANQPAAVAPSSFSEPLTDRVVSSKGITLTVHLKYRDYLTRMVTSWRMKGIALGIIAFIILTCLFAASPPDAVNSRGKTLLIMLATMVPILAVVFFVISFLVWRSDRKYLTPQQVALTSDGIEFASRDGDGLLLWTNYKYYLENRWSFIVWHPRGSLWHMFPKRQFASPSDLQECRELLQKNLRPSRWFFL